jgi:uncharacterized protein YcbX
MTTLQVSSLSIYPVKSTAALNLQRMAITGMGPQWDRRWMVVDNNGRFLTQRQLPLMCKVISRLNDEGLILSADGKTDLRISRHIEAGQRQVTVWDDEVVVVDCGDAAAAWLTDTLGKPCRLVYMPEHVQRKVDPQYADDDAVVSFADGFPLLLISEASLAALNQRLPNPVAMSRFRPNIVVRGCEAFAEDSWQTVRIAGIDFSVAKPCSRCIIPAIDPASGKKDMAVIKALQAFRRRGSDIYFGQNLIHHSEGELAVGDAVTVLSESG